MNRFNRKGVGSGARLAFHRERQRATSPAERDFEVDRLVVIEIDERHTKGYARRRIGRLYRIEVDDLAPEARLT